VVGLLVTGVVVLVLTDSTGAAYSGPLDPGNASPNGARALARVLEHHGMRLTVARGQAELASARVDRHTTVFVTSSAQLSRHTSLRMNALAADAGTLVLASAPEVTVEALGLGVHHASAPRSDLLAAGCADPLLAGLELDVTSASRQRLVAYGTDRAADAVETCFGEMVGGSVGVVVRVPRRPVTYLVGAAPAFANGHITGGDNAAVALRLLGRHRHLVWYVADTSDVPPGEAGSVTALLPRWLGLAGVLAGLALVATMVWRGRRLGPLVVEPLPVVVRSIESTTGRGLLYAQARDRGHAASTFREATVFRLTEHLGLPRGTTLDELVPVIAAEVDRTPDDVRRLLDTGMVPDDRTLTLLAQNLTTLEREVLRS
jgi:hypothetical protein